MTSARDLAAAYAIYAAAQLQGDETETLDFGHWLDLHWHDDPEGEPCLDDSDGFAARGTAVEWFEQGEEVVGVLAGRYRGCYRVPIASRPPVIALMLDDADGCSTGSVHQERAHVRAPLPAVGVLAAPAYGRGRPGTSPDAVLPPMSQPSADLALDGA